MDKKIIINLDENGKITAETEGILGEVCLEQLEELLDGIDAIVEVKKTDDFYMENSSLPRNKTNNQQKTKS